MGAHRQSSITAKIILTGLGLIVSAIWLTPFFSGATIALKTEQEMDQGYILPRQPQTLLFDLDNGDDIACEGVPAIVDAIEVEDYDACYAFFEGTSLESKFDSERECKRMDSVRDTDVCDIYDVYIVPMEDGSTQPLALAVAGRKLSWFMDPASPPDAFDDSAHKGQNPEGDGNLIRWDGNWRDLETVNSVELQWGNFPDAVDRMDFWGALFNTLMYALVSTTGAMISAAVVAYGFARFKFPGRNFLFLILLATIILPQVVTLIPTYAFWNFVASWSEDATRGWAIWETLTTNFPLEGEGLFRSLIGRTLAFFGVQKTSLTVGLGSWWPLFLPHFFANGYNVFLLRQYFMTIPPEMEEAAMIDGAGPITTFLQVILPQVVPALVAVSLFHFFFAWNDFFNPLVFLAGNQELMPLPVAMTRFNNLFGAEPTLIQAGALLTLIIPVLIFFFAQRVFVQGVVITGNK